jgi:hypothetical protein
MPANFVCLAPQAPTMFVASLVRAPTGRTTWRAYGSPRPALYSDNAWLGRISCIEWMRDRERHGGDDERAGQQQRTDIVADHGYLVPRSD